MLYDKDIQDINENDKTRKIERKKLIIVDVASRT